jgi:hypothetical protein
MKIAIAGLASNCHHSLNGLMASLMPALQRYFKEVKGFYVCKNPGIEKLTLRNYGTVVSDPIVHFYPPEKRYQKMAKLRNAYLNAIEKSGYNPDVVLCVDMDILRFDSWLGIDRIKNSDDWDSVAVMGLACGPSLLKWHAGPIIPYAGHDFVYYDTLAFESLKGERTLWPKNGPPFYPHGAIPAGTKLVHTAPAISTTEWTQVNTAFGPAAFYRWSKIKNFRFDETTMQICHYSICKHIRDSGGKIFIANDIVALYNAPK